MFVFILEPIISPERGSKLSDRDTPRLPQGYISVKEREKASCYSAVLEHFTKTFLYFRRAVVMLTIFTILVNISLLILLNK